MADYLGSPDESNQELEELEPTTRRNNDHLFQDMAKQNVPYPVGEKITAVEIATFFTNWLREYDPVFRLASNGASNSLLTEIINHHRKSSDKGEVMNNSLCKLTQTAVRSTGYHKYGVPKDIEDDWVEVKLDLWSIYHHNQANTKDCWGPWNDKSLAVGDVRGANKPRDGPLESVNFKVLAKGVKCFPSLENGDGLDLTRCVLYAKANPQETFMFPEDFGKICDLIGRTPVEKKHLDNETFERWALKYKENKKAARAARLVNPSPAVAKTTRSKISKARFVDPNNKVNKLRAKIEEAVDNGCLVLGDNGQLILLDKPKFKFEPVNPAAGQRTHSSALHSPVRPDAQAAAHNFAPRTPGSGASTVSYHSANGAAGHNPQASGYSYSHPTVAIGHHPQAGQHSPANDAIAYNSQGGVSTTNLDAQPVFKSNMQQLHEEHCRRQDPAPQSDHGTPTPYAQIRQQTVAKQFDYTGSDNIARLKSLLEYPAGQDAYQTNGASSAPAANGYTHASNEFQASGTVGMLDQYEFDVSSLMDPANATAFEGTPMAMGQTPHPTQAPSNMQHHVQDDLAAEVGFLPEFGGMPGMDYMSFPRQPQEASGAPQGFAGANYRGELVETLPLNQFTSSPPAWAR